MRAIRYSISELFLSVTLIAGGLGLYFATAQVADSWNLGALVPVLLLGATALIGAGCGALFRAKAVGALVGTACGMLTFFAILAYVSQNFRR
jgi:hypothetical protein